MTTEDAITAVLAREGGGKFTNDPADRGGPTKYGITQAALAFYRGHPVSAQDVEQLQEPEARAIYRANYIEKPGLHLIEDDELRAALFDFGVNSGPRAAIRALQEALSVPADGVLGPQTLEALALANAKKMRAEVVAERVVFLGRLISADPTQARFAHGWLRRAAEFIRGLA